ncbi:MAG: hypothetical protein AABZ26_02735 [Chloroflexota bacterium]
MPRLPDVDETLATLRAIATAPTAPYHEWLALDAIRRKLERHGIAYETDRYGQLHARVRRGDPRRSLVLVAHTDHPAFEVVAADGTAGTVRVLGGIGAAALGGDVPVRVHDDAGPRDLPAVVHGFAPDLDTVHNSPGRARIRADGPIAAGQWAVLDLPGLEQDGDQLRLRAADDLAGCSLIVSALVVLARASRDTPGSFDVRAVFTRAEETGLYGARLAVADGSIPRDAVIVSIEASRALPHVPDGAGIVVRAGDRYNTFTNDAERYLRVAQERLAAEGIPTQRALLSGGTCEGSTFVIHGWATTAMALPNVNYHNLAPHGRLAPEIVRLADLRSGIALAAEAAIAAGEDAAESWRPSAGLVPDEVRAILERRRA